MGDSDFKKKEDGTGEFQKDKRRRRTVTVEPVTRSPRPEGQTAYVPRQQSGDRYEKPQGERRSFNPNFSRDNKFIGGSKPQREERDFNRWDSGPERQPRQYNSDRPYEKKPYGAGGNDRPYERKSYGERQGGYEKKPYGDRQPGGYERKPYGERPAYDKPYQKKSYGDKPAFGRPYEKKPYNAAGPAKPYGKKTYGDRPGYDKPRKPFVKRGGEGVMDPGMKPAFYPSYSIPNTDKEVRLNRYIAMSGKCSRREADEYIQAGDITVNGVVVTELGSKIMPTDKVEFKGQPISSEKKVYIIMNKPKGYVTSIDDPHAEKTVMDIVRNACDERIYPVGRLDKSSVGVLLLTNDGDLTEKLTHPAYNKRKVYQVTLDAPLTNFDLQRSRDGIDLEDGIIIPDAVDFVKPDNRKEVGIEIHSGRNRIVRRIFEELGYGVHKLDRVYFAGLTKKNLKRGQWRFLTDREVGMLKSGQYE